MDPSLQKDVIKMAHKLAAAGREVLMEDASLSFKESLAQLIDQINTRKE